MTASQSERDKRLSRLRDCDRVRRQNKNDEERHAIMVPQNEKTESVGT